MSGLTKGEPRDGSRPRASLNASSARKWAHNSSCTVGSLEAGIEQRLGPEFWKRLLRARGAKHLAEQLPVTELSIFRSARFSFIQCTPLFSSLFHIRIMLACSLTRRELIGPGQNDSIWQIPHHLSPRLYRFLKAKLYHRPK